MPNNISHYDVCLSFAGEDREYVERVATALHTAGLSVFYDLYEQVSLWGRDLYQHLDDVYRRRATYCVVFISHAYLQKLWTKHELKSAQARAFEENREYILPVRLDETELPGVLPTTGYVSAKSPEELAELIIEKLQQTDRSLPVTSSSQFDTVDMSRLIKPIRHHWRFLVVLILAISLMVAWVVYNRTILGWSRAAEVNDGIYRVAINIVDPNNQPITDAEVLSSPSGVQKKTSYGWEIDIPNAALSKSKKLQVWAAKEGGIFKGSNEILLADDYNPTLTIVLLHDTSARIKGRITDDDGNPLSEAVVYIANYFSEKVTTGKSGLFDLPAHAAPGEHVHLFVERENYRHWNDVIPAGGESLAIIALTKK